MSSHPLLKLLYMRSQTFRSTEVINEDLHRSDTAKMDATNLPSRRY
jgi:hypothetical protein